MILILYLWGSCIAYLVIIGDSFSPLLALATGTGNVQILKQPVLQLSDALYHVMSDWQPLKLCHAASVAEIYHSLNMHVSEPLVGLNDDRYSAARHLCGHAGADSIFADRRLVITLVTLVIILPLCFPRELGALAWVSMAAVRLALTPLLYPVLADLSLGRCSIVCGSAWPRCASPSCHRSTLNPC